MISAAVIDWSIKDRLNPRVARASVLQTASGSPRVERHFEFVVVVLLRTALTTP
jgi:hypothetical protein